MNDSAVRQQAVQIISDQFGRETSYLYARYFENKSVDEVLTALADVLTGFIGEQKTKEIIHQLYSSPE